MSKLPALTPDDPLRAGTPVAPAQPAAPPTAAAKEPAETPAPRRRRAPRRPAAAPVPPRQLEPEAPQTPSAEEWTGATDVTTFRLPAEVLHALHERSRHLGVAKGMTVAAALLELLQRADDELVELVEQTQQRYDSARRRARRAA
jgi:hypothetical protein